MCADVDYFPQVMILTEQNLLLSNEFARKTSWTPSISSTSPKTNSTSWLERKLFSHFKRFFRRNSSASLSNSSVSSRRTSSVIDESITLHSSEQHDERHYEPPPPPPSSSSVSIPVIIHEQVPSITVHTPPPPPPLDSLYDYDQLLARCSKRQEHHRTEMLLRCQTPVTIPHADLIIGHAGSILVNWKSYVRLFRVLNRDPQLFQQYINQAYACQSMINQRELLTFTVRTSKSTFDNLLRTFLNEYVTCLKCEKAQTHLIKTTSLWRIECQLCGSQRPVQRLRWKR